MAEIVLSPRLQRFLKNDPNLLKKLKSALQNREAVIIEKGSNERLASVDENPVTFLEKRQLEIIHHDSKQQTLLKTKLQQWKNLITDLQSTNNCAIFTDEDFSKTYVCTNSAEFDSISTELEMFLNEKPGHMTTPASDLGANNMESLTSRGLNPMKTDIFKSEKMVCQTYLIEDTQYEFLARVKSVLNQTEFKFPLQVKLCHSVIPLVIDVNQFTKLSCVLKNEVDDFSVDNLIILAKKEPTEDYKLVYDRHDYKIWRAVNPKSPIANLVVHAEILTTFKKSKLNNLLEDCLLCVYESGFPGKVLGIKTDMERMQDWELFLNCLCSTVNHLYNEQTKIPFHYMILIIEKIESLTGLKSVFLAKSIVVSEEKDVQIRIIEGDLTKQKVDMIVNSTNVFFDLNYGTVSKALASAAGPKLQKECTEKSRFTYSEDFDFIVTNGYFLPCTYIFHGILPTNYSPHAITKFFLKFLKVAVNLKISSVAFPALGTGNLHYPLQEVAKEMNESLKIFKENYPNHGLKDIQLVLFPGQPEIKEVFSKAMIDDQLLTRPERKLVDNYQEKTLYWVYFVSEDPQTLKSGLKSFHMALQKVPLTMNETELEDMLFFTNLIELEPDIMKQLPNLKEDEIQLFVQEENLAEIKSLLEEIQTKLRSKNVQLKQGLNSKQIQILLQKLSQKFPLVKCQSIDENTVQFLALDLDMIHESINLLESILGLRESASIEQNYFVQDELEHVKFDLNKKPSKFEELPSLSTNTEEDKFDFNNSQLRFKESTSPLSRTDADTESVSHAPILTNPAQVPNQRNGGGILASLFNPFSNRKDTPKGISGAKSPDISCFQVDKNVVVKVYNDDFLNAKVEGIVNAANKHLAHAGGLAEHIIKHAGNAVDIEGRSKLNGKELEVGEVLTTSAGNLKQYKNIIHAVGPRYSTIMKNDFYCQTNIKKVVLNSLRTANELGLNSVALPAISSDIYGVPLPICTEGYVEGVKKFIRTRPLQSQLKEIHFVDRDTNRVTAIKQGFKKYFFESPMEIDEDYGAQPKESII